MTVPSGSSSSAATSRRPMAFDRGQHDVRCARCRAGPSMARQTRSSVCRAGRELFRGAGARGALLPHLLLAAPRVAARTRRRSRASRQAIRTSHDRKRSRFLRRSEAPEDPHSRFLGHVLRVLTRRRSTPYATRKARTEASARRSSNSRSRGAPSLSRCAGRRRGQPHPSAPVVIVPGSKTPPERKWFRPGKRSAEGCPRGQPTAEHGGVRAAGGDVRGGFSGGSRTATTRCVSAPPDSILHFRSSRRPPAPSPPPPTCGGRRARSR